MKACIAVHRWADGCVDGCMHGDVGTWGRMQPPPPPGVTTPECVHAQTAEARTGRSTGTCAASCGCVDVWKRA
eukprot:99917-Chlamydomonas_euryale.AAC.2